MPRGSARRLDKSNREPYARALQPLIGTVEDPKLGVSGLLWVRGGPVIESSDGMTYDVRNRVTLCRCGASSNKPFCDGSHASIAFTDG